jgi:hypothetical protein
MQHGEHAASELGLPDGLRVTAQKRQQVRAACCSLSPAKNLVVKQNV